MSLKDKNRRDSLLDARQADSVRHIPRHGATLGTNPPPVYASPNCSLFRIVYNDPSIHALIAREKGKAKKRLVTKNRKRRRELEKIGLPRAKQNEKRWGGRRMSGTIRPLPYLRAVDGEVGETGREVSKNRRVEKECSSRCMSGVWVCVWVMRGEASNNARRGRNESSKADDDGRRRFLETLFGTLAYQPSNLLAVGDDIFADLLLRNGEERGLRVSD